METLQLEKHKEEILVLGYTVLEDLVPEFCLDILNAKMNSDAHTLTLRGERGGYGSAEGHLQINPPPFAPYIFEEIIANKTVCAITKSILGNDLINNFYSANTSCPNSKPQVVHCDFGHLWKDYLGHPPVNLVVNVVLEEVTEFNGSTEIWPGSHKDFSFVCDFMDLSKNKTVPVEVLEARRKYSPPIRLNLKKGSIVIRDPRMWHRGMPNFSNRPRHMVAMIHTSRWVDPDIPFKFHPNCKEIFDQSPIRHNIVYSAEPFDYLKDPTEYHG
ncbi:phytanoyl-CoA dioxygenase family protein [Legionella septentrionalis]|uniref:phytanoyl-CoA dioxygenase family protein n=1 Tax=Legionella septentrionalis TaxID=2498109 RepID=UPI000F8CDB97|nr:phytanoyl-CoA dioxygenase family protein [Legionella septentrionalis]RUQ94631.1 hypothetical protein ELY11_10875 [Legionella septentrionalis]